MTDFGALKYLQINVNLPDNWKMEELAEGLGVSLVTAIGHYTCLLAWVGRLSPSGVLKYPNRAIARAAKWEGDPEVFVDALVRAKLVDRFSAIGSDSDSDVATVTVLVVHDWDSTYDNVAATREEVQAKSDGGRLGNHIRWDANRGIVNPECGFCMGTESVPTSESDIHREENSREEKSKALVGASQGVVMEA